MRTEDGALRLADDGGCEQWYCRGPQEYVCRSRARCLAAGVLVIDFLLLALDADHVGVTNVEIGRSCATRTRAPLPEGGRERW